MLVCGYNYLMYVLDIRSCMYVCMYVCMVSRAGLARMLM